MRAALPICEPAWASEQAAPQKLPVVQRTSFRLTSSRTARIFSQLRILRRSSGMGICRCLPRRRRVQKQRKQHSPLWPTSRCACPQRAWARRLRRPSSHLRRCRPCPLSWWSCAAPPLGRSRRPGRIVISSALALRFCFRARRSISPAVFRPALQGRSASARPSQGLDFYPLRPSSWPGRESLRSLRRSPREYRWHFLFRCCCGSSPIFPPF